MMFPFRRLQTCCLLLALLFAGPSLALQTAPIAVLPDIHNDYQRFLADRDVKTVTYYGGAYARRDVIELVLMLQALSLGGFSHPIQFVDEENYVHAQLGEHSAHAECRTG